MRRISTEHRGQAHRPRTSRSKSDDALRDTLSKLAHLDLTPYVQYDRTVMSAHGGYCDVFIGAMKIFTTAHSHKPTKETKVAVKRLRVDINSDRDFAKLLAKELLVWSKLNHTNILPLLGYVLDSDYPCVVSEWIENGTVRTYLRENPTVDTEYLIIGIANGVEYLHCTNIVHSDLQAENVLVDRFGKPLICDFGISRMLASSLTIAGSSTGELRGSCRWMAVELLNTNADACHTKETDVWAYGMTVYEILARELPYARFKNDPQVIIAITRGELPTCPPDFWPLSLMSCWEICEACWVSPPEKRITTGQIVAFLSANLSANVVSNHRETENRPALRVNTHAPQLLNSMDDTALHRPNTSTALKVNDGEGMALHGPSLYTLEPCNMTPVQIVVEPPTPTMPSTKFELLPPNSYSDYQQLQHAHPSESYYSQQASPKITDLMYPTSMSVHPLLKNANYVHLDLSLHIYAPEVPEGSWIPKLPPQIASYPAVTDIQIICRAFGPFVDAWAIRITPGRTVTVSDVLPTLHKELRRQVTHTEWSRLSEFEAHEASRSFSRRCRGAEFEWEQGVRRVDLLGDKHWFGGLEKVRDDDPHNFELLVETRSPP